MLLEISDSIRNTAHQGRVDAVWIVILSAGEPGREHNMSIDCRQRCLRRIRRSFHPSGGAAPLLAGKLVICNQLKSAGMMKRAEWE